MANRLKMASIQTIFTLWQQRWSIRRIARSTGVHRDTIARHVRRFEAGENPANTDDFKLGQAPIGADGSASDPKLGRAPIGSERGATPSRCEAFRALIVAKLEQGLTAQRIYQDLVREHGFTARYHSVRRFVGHLRATSELPFRRMECAAGEEAQVDFGTGAMIVLADGKRRRTHVFRIVLSYSRKAYSEAVYRQTTEEFLRCLENAFWHFGGAPKTLVLDNLKAGVLQPDWFDPELNPKLRSFAAHYGMAILPTRPRLPRHKGKIENGVGYVKDNALKGHTFGSLEEQNRHLLDWETNVADTRIHGTTRRQVAQVFAEERPALLPLPCQRFPFFHEGTRVVHRDGHIEVAKAYYSAPPEYLGRRVWVRWDGRLVRILNERLESIAVHAQQEPGRFSTQPMHIAAEKINGIERGLDWLMSRVERVGAQAVAWAQAVVEVRGIEGLRVLQGLLALLKKHRSQAVDRACGTAHACGSYHLKSVRRLLDRPGAAAPAFEFLAEHPLIRDMADYETWLQETQ
jgi:transposase